MVGGHDTAKTEVGHVEHLYHRLDSLLDTSSKRVIVGTDHNMQLSSPTIRAAHLVLSRGCLVVKLSVAGTHLVMPAGPVTLPAISSDSCHKQASILPIDRRRALHQ